MIKFNTLFKNMLRNKRILYIFSISILLIFCLVLNVTFSLFTTGNLQSGVNIKIGDLSYVFDINTEYEELKSSIYNDRVIRVEANTTKIYYVNLISENKYDTKYQIIYNYCSSYDLNTNVCTYSNNLPEKVSVFFSEDTIDMPNGIVAANSFRNIKVVVENKSNNTYYYELGILAGYKHNDLNINVNNGIAITQNFAIPDPNEVFELITYVDGVEVEEGIFPTTGYFTSYVTCEYPDGTMHDDVGIARWNGTRWLITVTEVPNNVFCKAYFTTNNNPYPIFTYMIGGVDYTNDTSKVELIEDDDDGSWRIKFKESGTFNMSFPELSTIDVFLVGGGGGGGAGDRYYAGGGGGGGYTKTVSNISINANTDYTITIGAGGASATVGSKTTAFNQTVNGGNPGQNTGAGGSGGSGGGNGGLGTGVGAGASNGNSASPGGSGQGSTTGEFGVSTATLYSGGGGGGASKAGAGGGYQAFSAMAGGTGGGGYGGGLRGAGASGTKNTGGGGGGGGATGNEASGGGGAGGTGGSGIAVIRNARD